METTNALKLRQSLGAILKKLKASGGPILVEKDRKPAAVLISIEDFQSRFVDKTADAARELLIQKIKSFQFKLPPGKSSLSLIRDLRS